VNDGSTAFFLPFGFLWEDKLYRKGHIRLATIRDEIEIQNSDDLAMTARYRDVLLLAKVITDFEALKPVTVEMIECLYEADFLYLQALYKELNGETDEEVVFACPYCDALTALKLPKLYEDMTLYKQKEEGKG